MPKGFLVIILILLFHSIRTESQNLTISGYIKDCENNHALSDVFLSIDTEDLISISDKSGYFQLTEVQLPTLLYISDLGYESKEIWIDRDTKFPLDICLSSKQLQLPEITIKDKHKINFHSQETPTIEQLAKIPAIAGEIDLMKALTILPSVSQGREGSSDIYVRGGDKDQNLILIDGVPVYNMNHLSGYFSLFNYRTIKNLDFYNGAIPTKHGNRLSSLIDVELKEGRPDSLIGAVEAGTLTSQVFLEIPFKKSNSGLMLSGRSSYLGLVNLFKSKKKSEYYIDYWLYDFYAKYHTNLAKGKLNISFYTGLDYATVYSDETYKEQNILRKYLGESNIRWGNNLISLNYLKPLNNKTSLDINLGYSEYKTKQDFEEEVIDIKDGTNEILESFKALEEFTIKTLLTNLSLIHYPTTWLKLSSGTQLSYNESSISIGADDKFSFTDKFFYSSVSPFIEGELSISPRVQTTVGVHYNATSFRKLWNSILVPRLNLSYAVNDNLKLYVGANKNYQYFRQYTFRNLGLEFQTYFHDINNSPATAWEYQIGSKYKGTDSGLGLSVYYKTMKNLHYIPFANIGMFQDNHWVKNILQDGTGKAYGLETYYKYSFQNLSIYGSYTLAYVTRHFSELNEGRPFFFDFDQRHNLNITTSYIINDKWAVSGLFVFLSGRPFTLPSERVPIGGTRFDTPTGQNGVRLPPYHRFDISFERKTITSKGNTRIWTFSAYNLYNRKNPNSAFIRDYPVFEDGEFAYTKSTPTIISYFSILPSIHFSYEF